MGSALVMFIKWFIARPNRWAVGLAYTYLLNQNDWKNPMFFFEFKGALIEVKHLKKSNCFALIAITVISCLLSFLWTHCPEKRKESVILNADLSRVQGQCGVTWKMFCHQGRFLTLALNIINQIFDLQFYFQSYD